jgi:CheY-like chemotaxis protein
MTDQPVVLYVEDERRSRKVMQMLLSYKMHLPHVTIFEDSTDIVERADALDPKPDIIFLDIHIQPYDGFQMLDMLRQSHLFDDVPIVALTASVMNEEVQRLRIAGFNGCLSKPIDTDTFPDLLQRVISGETIWRIAN